MLYLQFVCYMNLLLVETSEKQQKSMQKMFCYNINSNNNKNTVKNGHNIETNAALYGWCIDIIDTNDYNNA